MAGQPGGDRARVGIAPVSLEPQPPVQAKPAAEAALGTSKAREFRHIELRSKAHDARRVIRPGPILFRNIAADGRTMPRGF